MRYKNMMMKKNNHSVFIKISIICFLSAFLFACGYSFAPQGESIDRHIQTVYVQPFENKTAYAGIENYVRTAFINQFIQNSRFKMAPSAETADAIVKGRVLNLIVSSLSYSANTLAKEERATIFLELTFQDSGNGKIIWSSNNVTGWVDYTLNSDINMLPSDRKNAFAKLANDTAEKVFNLMMSGF